MLNPDDRSLYTEAVCPPRGHVLDLAIATTYSLDPEAVLSLPTHLALAERSSSADGDPIKLLESIRRLSGRFSVYADHAGIKIPSRSNVLFGLLESMVIPVRAPRGGVFHPKLWVLRFVQPDMEEPPWIRVLVLSRNITFDRSWDIVLRLEGRPGSRDIAANRPLGELLLSLPSISTRPVTEQRRLHAEQLAGEIGKTAWELPEGFEEVSFQILGIDNRSWNLPWSKRMAVVSPFLTDDALSWLGERTEALAAVVSRPDEMNRLESGTLQRAKKWFTLDEAAETEDGEEPEQRDTVGLHAKAYITEQNWRTRLYLGSANATGAALLHRNNIEILVGLAGRTSRVGGIDALFSEKGLGTVLSEYIRPDEIPPADDGEILARKVLEAAGTRLAEAGLRVVCKGDEHAWRLTVVSPGPVALPGIGRIRSWPITVREDRASDVMGLVHANAADLGMYATESVTGLIAFELVADIKKMTLRMVLNLPVEGLPENRDDAVFRLVLDNKEGFLRYLLLLLGEYAGGFLEGGAFFGGRGGGGSRGIDFSGDVPILEELARVFSRNPEKLKDVRAVVNRLMREQATTPIIPAEFIHLWAVFENAIMEAGT